ncbi:MAG: hypothetical protein ICV54_05310 [Nostoc sp. C3-bin3]|nr:hypothetical protein [Nostoc sp. C3-bin3]
MMKQWHPKDRQYIYRIVSRNNRIVSRDNRIVSRDNRIARVWVKMAQQQNKLQERTFVEKRLSQYLNKPIFEFQKCLLNIKIVEVLSNPVIGQLSNYLD